MCNGLLSSTRLMIPQEIIRQKRNGETLSAADIAGFIGALARNELSEGQIGAFAMAVWFRGMSREETVALTSAMARSGFGKRPAETCDVEKSEKGRSRGHHWWNTGKRGKYQPGR